MMDFLYFDNHSATKPFAECLEKFLRFSKEYWALSSAPHFLGQQQLYPLQKSVDVLYKELGIHEKDEIFFGSNGKEVLSHVFFTSYFHEARENGKTLFLIPETEEAKYFSLSEHFKSLGCAFKFLRVNSKGHITPETLKEAITPRTALVSMSWAGGVTGVLQPVAELSEVCKEKGVLFHLDASYVYGKLFFRFEDLNVDFLTLDGSVLHASKDSALLISKAKNSPALLTIEKEKVPTAGICSFSHALEILQEKFEHYCMEIARLRDRFEQSVCRRCPGARVLFKDSDRLPTATVISFLPIYSEPLFFLLNSKGVYACMGGGKFQSLSVVLKASGYDDLTARSSLSFILSHEVTEEEIDRAVEIIGSCFDQLKTCVGDEQK